MVLGLLLVSCSDVKTEKMLETCADENFERVFGNTPLLTLRLKGKLLDENYYSYHANCEEDLNNDGFVGVSDLLIIIDAWGVC